MSDWSPWAISRYQRPAGSIGETRSTTASGNPSLTCMTRVSIGFIRPYPPAIGSRFRADHLSTCDRLDLDCAILGDEHIVLAGPEPLDLGTPRHCAKTIRLRWVQPAIELPVGRVIRHPGE